MWKVRRSRGYGCEITDIAVRLRSPAGAVFGCFGESAQCRLRLVGIQRDVSSRMGLRRLGTGWVAR